ncbi:MAG: hypothetical protein QM831_35640 [Kofleriaceae bacterium]
MRRAISRIGLAIALAACSKHHDAPSTGSAAPVGSNAGLPFDEITVDLPPGESDLSIDDKGHLWAVAERDHVISELELVPNGPPKITPHPMDGVPDGVDTESLAWLGNGNFVIGTEGQHEPSASLLAGHLEANGHITVTPKLSFTNDQLGLTLIENHGAEALCGHGDDVYVAIESTAVTPEGKRWAPFVHVHGDQVVGVQKLLLTSDKGKISAIDCDFGMGLEVRAIERHYGVSRIVSFDVVPGKPELAAVVDLDLWPIVRDHYHEKLNLEGIVTTPDGRWVLINDDQGANVDGPTMLFVFHKR